MGTTRRSVESTGECVWNSFCPTNSWIPLSVLRNKKNPRKGERPFLERGIASTSFHGVKPQEIPPRLFSAFHAFHTPKAFCSAAP